jgi:predicted nuclease with TOPRIM domain
MDTDSLKILILVINNDSEETDTIKSWLDKDMRVPWSISHCVNVEEARSRVTNADLVILKPEMDGPPSAKEVFKNIDDMVFEVPILVLKSDSDEHELSTYVMEQGAADTIIRGQFSRLVDAIEFALIRQRLKTDARKATDKALLDSRDKNDSDLKTSHAEKNAEVERHRQILRMFTGDYAVDK